MLLNFVLYITYFHQKQKMFFFDNEEFSGEISFFPSVLRRFSFRRRGFVSFFFVGIEQGGKRKKGTIRGNYREKERKTTIGK